MSRYFEWPGSEIFIYYPSTTSVYQNQFSNYYLSQNYPNPFNPSTKIEFTIPKSSFVKLEIFDALGRKLEELINQYLSVGSYNVIFNAEKYSSGVYYYRLSTDDVVKMKKSVLLK